MSVVLRGKLCVEVPREALPLPISMFSEKWSWFLDHVLSLTVYGHGGGVWPAPLDNGRIRIVGVPRRYHCVFEVIPETGTETGELPGNTTSSECRGRPKSRRDDKRKKSKTRAMIAYQVRGRAMNRPEARPRHTFTLAIVEGDDYTSNELLRRRQIEYIGLGECALLPNKEN